MSNTPVLLKGADILTPTEVLPGSSALIVEGCIKQIGPESEELPAGTQVLDITGHILTPGLIDLHFQGLMGHDVWDSTPDAMRSISSDLARFGVTSFMCTSSFWPDDKFDTLVSLLQDDSLYAGARPQGLYLEGPFVSADKRGGIPADRLHAPSARYLDKVVKAAHGKLRIMTVAPELPGIMDIIAALTEIDVTVAIGHTNATYEQTVKAIDAGASHVTHLFNAMSPLHHREPGASVALLMDDRITVEQILDGIHIHPACIDMVIKLKGPERVAIVTDSIKAAGLQDGDYLFGDGVRVVHVRDGAPRLDDGRLAGSSLTMNRAVRNMVRMVGRGPLEAVRMATLTPATVMGLADRKGRIEPGYDADLVVFDEDWRVRATMIAGEFVFNELHDDR